MSFFNISFGPAVKTVLRAMQVFSPSVNCDKDTPADVNNATNVTMTENASPVPVLETTSLLPLSVEMAECAMELVSDCIDAGNATSLTSTEIPDVPKPAPNKSVSLADKQRSRVVRHRRRNKPRAERLTSPKTKSQKLAAKKKASAAAKGKQQLDTEPYLHTILEDKIDEKTGKVMLRLHWICITGDFDTWEDSSFFDGTDTMEQYWAYRKREREEWEAAQKEFDADDDDDEDILSMFS